MGFLIFSIFGFCIIMIIAVIKFRYKGEYNNGDINVTCPHCNANLTIPNEGSFLCPECNNIFIYELKIRNHDIGNNNYQTHTFCRHCNQKIVLNRESYYKCYNCGHVIYYFLNNDIGNDLVENEFAKSEPKAGFIFSYMTCAFGIIAKCNGNVSIEKLNFIHNVVFADFFKYSSVIEVDMYKKIFDCQKYGAKYFYILIKRIYEFFLITCDNKLPLKDNEKNILLGFVATLFIIAYYGKDTKYLIINEEELLSEVISAYNLKKNEVENLIDNITKTHTKESSKKKYNDDIYKILECNEKSSNEEIKKNYRLLMQKYHPDKYLSKNLPDDFIELANEKSIKINKAYEKIKRIRGFN